jgi:hypothetical protein
VLGGLAVWGGASTLPVPTMILFLAVLSVVCAIGAYQIGGPTHAPHKEEDSGASVLQILEETPYLRNVALLVALLAFSGAFYDYVFKARAAAHFTTGPELVSFFALFYLCLGVATFLMQNLLARRSLLVLGLAVTVGLLPGALVSLGLIALLVPGIAAATLMRGGVSVTENSFYRSGYELLYTPLAPEKKRSTKTLIDVGVDKLGAAAGAGVAFFVLGIFPVVANSILLVIGIGAGVAAGFLTRLLHQGYVHTLTESLRSGSIDAAGVDALDATTRRAVTETVVELKRSDVLESASSSGQALPGRAALLERLSAGSGTGPGARRHRPFTEPPRREPDASEVDDTIAAVIDLRSGDRTRIEVALRAHQPLPESLAAHVLPLLANEEVADAAAAALRKVAPAHTGLLLDAALHTRMPLHARRRVCDILGRLPTQRCANGLVLLLADREFELRFRAAAGLLRAVRANPRLRLPREQLFDAATREAVDSQRRWRSQTAVTGKLTRTATLDSAEGKRVVQGLAYVFTLLLAVLDREPLTLAIRALANPEGGHRGTGLEYLDNVLPAGLKQALWPLLEDRRLALERVRSRSEILAEVMGSRMPGPADLATLREQVEAKRAQRATLH